MKSTTCPCCTHPDGRPEGPWLRCPGCGHRWRWETDDGSTAHYEHLIARNDTASAAFARKLRDRLDTLVPLLPAAGLPCRILEVGCAEGHLGEALKKLRPLDYDGIEISRDAEAAARRIDMVFRQPAVRVDAPPYDRVLAFHVLEHILDPAAELAEWKRLLATDGLLVLEVPRESGHPLVAVDPNPEHLHQFTPASLLCLLRRIGLEAVAISGGHYESAVYMDNVRVTARVRESATDRADQLVERFRRRLGGPFLVYGIGGDFRGYVQPVLDRLPVADLLDSAPEKWGTQCAGRTIARYDPDRHGGLPVLVGSVRFKSDILATLDALGVPATLTVGLDEIYDPA